MPLVIQGQPNGEPHCVPIIRKAEADISEPVYRAMLYSMYLAEEIFTGSADYSIAKGCVGTHRTGLRGQTGRCDLAEFCDHLFIEIERATGERGSDGKLLLGPDGKPRRASDVKPDKDAARSKWSKKALDLAASDLFKATQAIDSIKFKSTTAGVPSTDYTGGLNPGKILAGATNYYDVMGQVGGAFSKAQAEIEKIVAEDAGKPAKDRVLSASQTKNLQKWALEGKRGTQFVYELRIKDTAKYQMMPEGLKSTFGHDIQSKPRNYNDDDFKAKFGAGFGNSLQADLGSWPEPSKELTVDKWSSAFANKAAAEAKYDEALADYFATQSGADHKAAIDSADKSRVSAGC